MSLCFFFFFFSFSIADMAKQMLLAVILVMAVTAMRVVSGDRIWCTNPDDYEGRSYCDHWGGYCGQCVSFVKVLLLIAIPPNYSVVLVL